jgi:hypothetical protein
VRRFITAVAASSEAPTVCIPSESVGYPSVARTTIRLLLGRRLLEVNMCVRTKSSASAVAVVPPAAESPFIMVENWEKSTAAASVRFRASIIVVYTSGMGSNGPANSRKPMRVSEPPIVVVAAKFTTKSVMFFIAK